VTTGNLKLFVTDVRLPRGLELTRYYVSGRPAVTSLGRGWSHSLDWALARSSVSEGNPPLSFEVATVGRPHRSIAMFVRQAGGSPFTGGSQTAGLLTVDAQGFATFTDGTGTEVTFDASNALVEIRAAGEAPVAVTHDGLVDTFTRAGSSLSITYSAPPGDPARRVTAVAALGETWTYTYGANDTLASVLGPDPSTALASDTLEWIYEYQASYPPGLIERKCSPRPVFPSLT
jgi:hypothetical protein